MSLNPFERSEQICIHYSWYFVNWAYAKSAVYEAGPEVECFDNKKTTQVTARTQPYRL